MRLQHYTKENWRTFRRQPLAEISGAVGDLGTFLPILIALSVNGTVSFSNTLILTGIFNILTGVFFGIPLPVQPMKAVAAVAIANDFSPGEIAAAGLFVGACILVFSVTGALSWFTRVVPIPVVKGIQVGAGLSLLVSAGGSLRLSLSWVHPSWADNYIWAIVVLIGLSVTNIYRRVPFGLILFILGLVFAIILVIASHGSLPWFEISYPWGSGPNLHDWRVGIVDAGIGQLPLTTLNSIIAVVHLSADLLPDVNTPSVTSIGLSVAGMNIFGICLGFNTMPVCHGSGGLAAQYRFGARSGASIIFLGIVKLVLGLLFGQTLVGLLEKFPTALLGVMVIAAGLELASVGESLNTAGAWDLGKRDQDSPHVPASVSEVTLSESEKKKRWTVMIATIGLLLAFKNTGIGFLAGMLFHWSYDIPELVEKVRQRWSRGRIRLPDHE